MLRFLYKRNFVNYFDEYKDSFESKKGFEIGGPTKLFSTDMIPVYQIAEEVDGCNFNSKNIWNNTKNSSILFYDDIKGRQFYCEGSDLSEIDDESYDFILSSHNIEHIANPIKALKEWLRVLRYGGTLLLVVPNKKMNFDRKRDFTALEHLISDFENGVDERDLTHLDEVLKKHDLSLDPDAEGDFDSFEKRCRNNYEIRGLHHHVFSQKLLLEVFDYLDIQILFQYNIPHMHQVIVGRKKMPEVTGKLI